MPSDPVAPSPIRYLRVSPERAGQRIDNFLLSELKGVPRTALYRLLRTGQVRVNQGRVKPAYRLASGDQIRVPPLRLPTPGELAPPPAAQLRRLELAVLYEDAGFMVVNKPAGMAVHGGSGLSFGVIEGLRALRPREPDLELVHRLDRDTSGCLLVAKRRAMLRWLHEQIRQQTMHKRYLALLAGAWQGQGRVRDVDAPLLKNTLQSGERMVRVDPDGKPSRTQFRLVRRYPGASLVEARLETGRTHQIRVHAAYLGTPVLGDDKYGDRETNRAWRERGLRRLFLHAAALTFALPEAGRTFRVEAPLSPDLEAVLDCLAPQP